MGLFRGAPVSIIMSMNVTRRAFHLNALVILNPDVFFAGIQDLLAMGGGFFEGNGVMTNCCVFFVVPIPRGRTVVPKFGIVGGS